MSDKEIIEKIEAEARKIKPKVLNSKRSAFLNKETSYTEQECRSGLGETIEVPESSAGSSHHVWRVCKVWQCGGYTPGLPGTPQSWSNANVITCISMGGTGPSWSNGNTYSPIPPAQWGDDFYDHVSTLVGGINVGDQIEIDISHAQPTVTSGSQAGNTPGSAVCLSSVFPSAAFPNAPNGTANKFCFEYLGTASLARVGQPVSIGNYTWYGYGTMILGYENTVFTALNNNCCFNACYDIGDTGPEGGTIFAVPLGHPQNNGVNQTNFYCEVAKNDIATAGTPVAGFNTSCGNTVTTTTSQNIPNMAVTGIVLQVTGTYNVNIGDEITSLTPGLFPPGTTIASIMSTPSGLTGFTASNPANFAGNHAIILTSTSPPVPWSATGAEWGVYDKPNIITSTDFGTGHKNTDVIDAYPLSPGNPTGGIHPWLDTHDIAATICKQHPSAKDDWFLPSRDEFIEMVDASNAYGFTLGLNGLGQFSEHQYWTSSQYRHDPNLGLPPQFPDKYSWTVKSNGAPGLAYRCHALSVRPIRRFECEVEPDPIEKGITYDYRIDTFGHSCAGTIYDVVNPGISQYTSATYSVDAYAFSMLNQSTGSGGNIIFNTSDLVLTIDSTTVSSLPNIGGYLNDIGGIPYSQFGPIVDVIDIATHPVLGVNLPIYQNAAGANIDTFIVFNPLSNFSGPNGFFIGQNYSQGTFIDNISYDIQTLNPLWSAPVFGSSYEIGHPRLNIGGFNRLDVRMNDVVGLGYNDRIVQRIGEIFNIKIYNQYEELLGDWDYKLTGESGGFGCCVSHCYKGLVMVRSQTNYVNPLYSSHPDVVDLKVYHEGLGVGGHPEGWAYFAITCVTDPTFNSNFTRGNTLNLENWRGTGQNNRTKDTTYPISGMQWKWQRETCGVSTRGHCCGGTCGRYHAEVNPPLNNIYCNAFNSWTPNHTALFDNKNHCQSGQLDVVGGSVSKLIGPSENYPSEINECFERGIEEVDVHVIPQVSGENTSKRQKFINDKKPKETGPFGIAGYYPLYDTIEAATYNSPTPIESRTGENTYGYHIHDFAGQEYYMPNGLEMGKTQFHGDYDGQVIPETTVQPETIQPEQPSIVTITPIEPEQEEEPPTTTPTYTPPPSTSSGGSGGGGY